MISRKDREQAVLLVMAEGKKARLMAQKADRLLELIDQAETYEEEQNARADYFRAKLEYESQRARFEQMIEALAALPMLENGAGRRYRRNTYHFHDVRWKERLHQSRCRQAIEDAYRVLSSASAARLDAVPDGEYAFQVCGEPGLEGDYIIGEVKNRKVVVFKTLYVSGDSKMIPSWATPVIRYECVKPLTQGGEVWAHGSVNALEGCSKRDAQVDDIVSGALRSSRFGLSPTEVAELTRAVTRSEAAMALRRMFFLRKVDHVGRYHKSNEPRFAMSRR